MAEYGRICRKIAEYGRICRKIAVFVVKYCHFDVNTAILTSILQIWRQNDSKTAKMTAKWLQNSQKTVKTANNDVKTAYNDVKTANNDRFWCHRSWRKVNISIILVTLLKNSVNCKMTLFIHFFYVKVTQWFPLFLGYHYSVDKRPFYDKMTVFVTWPTNCVTKDSRVFYCKTDNNRVLLILWQKPAICHFFDKTRSILRVKCHQKVTVFVFSQPFVIKSAESAVLRFCQFCQFNSIISIQTGIVFEMSIPSKLSIEYTVLTKMTFSMTPFLTIFRKVNNFVKSCKFCTFCNKT